MLIFVGLKMAWLNHAFGGKFPYLRAGDVVEIEIEGLGHQRQEFVAWEAQK